jgi:hypothetical protein
MRIRDSVAQNLRLGGPEFAAPKFPYILTQGLDPRWPRICTSFTSHVLTQGLDRRWPKIDSLKCRWPKKNTISYRSGFASFSVCAFARASPWIPHTRQRICIVRGEDAHGSAKTDSVFGAPTHPHAERTSRWMCLRSCLGQCKFWATILSHRIPYSHERHTGCRVG